jgi:hypothetical protein
MGRKRRGGSYRRGGKGYSRNVGYYGRYKSAMGMIPTGVQWGGELKFADLSHGATMVTGAFDLFHTGAAFTIAAGTGESNRIGRKILIKNISLQMQVNSSEGALATFTNQEDARYRIMVVLDKQVNGSPITSEADVLDITTITDPTVAYHNLANKNRFVTLMDKKFNWVPQMFDNAGAPYYASKSRTFNFYKKFDNLPIEYSGTTGAITEIASNSIFVLVCEVSTSAARMTPAINYDGRVRFVDG